MKNPPRGRRRIPQPCLDTHYSPKPARKIGACVQHTIGHIVDVNRIVGFSWGPKPLHRTTCPTNRAKKPMTRTLHCPPPLAPMIDWRARKGSRRWRRGAHPHWTYCGDCQTALAANSGQCRPTRPIDKPVGRQDNISTTAGAAGAPTSRLRAQRWKISFGKDVSKGKVKRYDDGPSVVGSAQRGLSYAEVVSKR